MAEQLGRGELEDPDISPERLGELVDEYPELRAEIILHPNLDQSTRVWLRASSPEAERAYVEHLRRTGQAPAGDDGAAADAPAGPIPVPAPAPASAGSPAERPMSELASSGDASSAVDAGAQTAATAPILDEDLARAEIQDPDQTDERLGRLADDYAALRPMIVLHRNLEESTREWIRNSSPEADAAYRAHLVKFSPAPAPAPAPAADAGVSAWTQAAPVAAGTGAGSPPQSPPAAPGAAAQGPSAVPPSAGPSAVPPPAGPAAVAPQAADGKSGRGRLRWLWCCGCLVLALVLLLGLGGCLRSVYDAAREGSSTGSSDGGYGSSDDGEPTADPSDITESESPTSAAPAVAFMSPSENISCELSEDGAACTILERDAGVVGCTGGDFASIVLEADATEIRVDCDTRYPASGPDPSLEVLEYGDSREVGDMTCEVESSGMTCTSARTGHGFQLARSTLHAF